MLMTLNGHLGQFEMRSAEDVLAPAEQLHARSLGLFGG
jgi:hypothetical protein